MKVHELIQHLTACNPQADINIRIYERREGLVPRTLVEKQSYWTFGFCDNTDEVGGAAYITATEFNNRIAPIVTQGPVPSEYPYPENEPIAPPPSHAYQEQTINRLNELYQTAFETPSLEPRFTPPQTPDYWSRIDTTVAPPVSRTYRDMLSEITASIDRPRDNTRPEPLSFEAWSAMQPLEVSLGDYENYRFEFSRTLAQQGRGQAEGRTLRIPTMRAPRRATPLVDRLRSFIGQTVAGVVDHFEVSSNHYMSLVRELRGTTVDDVTLGTGDSIHIYRIRVFIGSVGDNEIKQCNRDSSESIIALAPVATYAVPEPQPIRPSETRTEIVCITYDMDMPAVVNILQAHVGRMHGDRRPTINVHRELYSNLGQYITDMLLIQGRIIDEVTLNPNNEIKFWDCLLVSNPYISYDEIHLIETNPAPVAYNGLTAIYDEPDEVPF